MFDQDAYNRAYYLANAERLRARSRERYRRLRDDPDFQEKIKARRERQHFGVPREVVLRKTNGKCYYCEKPAEIVHHLDHDGRGHEHRGEEPGRDPQRLVGACRACHMDLHRHEMMLAKKTRANGHWARNYDCCVECGQSDRPHSGHGLCVNCAERKRRAARKARKEGGV